MKITVQQKVQAIPRPTTNSAVALKEIGKDVQVLVLLCPTPRGYYCLFVGNGSNSYIPVEEWEAYVPTRYTLVHAGPLSTMEVTFNA